VTIDFSLAQRRLISGSYSIGGADGVPGPKTWAGILAFVGQRQMSATLPLGEAAAVVLHGTSVVQSPARLANFLGQAAHESGSWRYLREIWGPSPAQRGYEGRADLGNCRPGDGRLFCGRGLFQLTGRGNYARAGKALGLDLETHPQLVEQPAIAWRTALWFWTTHNLDALADAGREDDITRKINGGVTGIERRRALVQRAKGLFV